MDILSTRVFVRGLSVYGYHGVSEAEQTVGHRLSIDISAEVDQSASLTDDVAETVSYADLAAIAIEVSEGSKFRTLERLAQAIAEVTFSRHARCRSLWVDIAKPMPPAPFISDVMGVEMTFERYESG